MKISKSSHGGQVIRGDCIFECKCGRFEKTSTELDLPLGWVKLVIWRGTMDGTTLNDIIKCPDCQSKTIESVTQKIVNRLNK